VFTAGKDHPALAQAARSWMTQSHPSWEIVLAGSQEALDSAAVFLQSAGVDPSRIVTARTDIDTDAAAALNAAAHAARGRHLVLIDSPFIGLTNDWLRRLLGYCNQPGIAAAGPVVLAPNGQIKEAGIAIANGLPLSLLYGLDGAVATPTTMNVSAVSGAVATPRDTFEQLDGLRPQMRELAMIDYCLRAREAGMRVVSVPDARVRSIGPDTVINDLPGLWRFRQTWSTIISQDPYYHPSYRQDRGDRVPWLEPRRDQDADGTLVRSRGRRPIPDVVPALRMIAARVTAALDGR
jgi:hypothetical protein